MEIFTVRSCFVFIFCVYSCPCSSALPTEIYRDGNENSLYSSSSHGDVLPPGDDADPSLDLEVSHEETRLIQEISQVFGIGNFSGISTEAGRVGKDRSTPPFMLSMYNSIANSTNGEERADTPYQASTIRSVKNVKANRRNRNVLHFKIDVVPSSERLLNAELYLFRLFPKLKGDRPKYYQVSVYQRTETGSHRLVDSRRVSSHGTGWEIFNVYETVREWLTHEASNNGFYINITTMTGERAPDGALRFSMKKDDRRPNLVLFTQERSGRDPTMVDGSGEPPSHTTAEPHLTGHPRFRREAKVTADPTEKTCGIDSMYVNFEQLGWADHIVAPMGFNSNRCSGRCPFPAKEDIPYSTHALIQGFMAMEFPSIEGACCVPHELSSLTFLYVDQSYNVVLRRVKNAVAVKCGCH